MYVCSTLELCSGISSLDLHGSSIDSVLRMAIDPIQEILPKQNLKLSSEQYTSNHSVFRDSVL